MARCLLAVGSNLGDRSEQLLAALREIVLLPRLSLLARSRWHETVPVGGPANQQPFLNGVLLVETPLPPDALLGRLLEIETRLGRQRDARWGPRALDLDLLLYEEQVCQTEKLQLPHPRMSFRRFVLQPAVEIAGSMRHPTSGWTLAQLLWHLNTAAESIAVVAADSQSANSQAAGWLVDALAEKLRGSTLLEQIVADDRQQGGQASPPTIEFPRAVASGSWCQAISSPRPKLAVAWDNRGNGPAAARPVLHASYARGPLAYITTTDRQQALAEAMAAARAVWPRMARGGKLLHAWGFRKTGLSENRER